jgi:hypothetical protein
VVLGHPVALETPTLGVTGEVNHAGERLRRGATLDDRAQVKKRKWDHGSPTCNATAALDDIWAQGRQLNQRKKTGKHKPAQKVQTDPVACNDPAKRILPSVP